MSKEEKKTLTIDGLIVEIEGERNLLEIIRKVGIDLPTFCYHSDLSVYGACRLCLVEVAGRGIMASCSTSPEPDMIIRTNTAEIRQMRKINLELLLANHDRECPSCSRSNNCTLQNLARQLGVEEVRFKKLEKKDMKPVDRSSPSIVRDPNKCVLCGDCVRVCEEVQGIGAIDFAFRGAKACVSPAFDKDLGKVECVNCGQCAAVCPTGALVPKQERDDVWALLADPNKYVVAAFAPAVRVGLGEYFGMEPGTDVTGRIVTALRMLGFDQVYDITFAADMTIVEEANELLERVGNGGTLPMFTSCCPGWVKFTETYFPELMPNLSSCKSPQQMFGSTAHKVLPGKLNIAPENLAVVSIMPCTAKKFEAKLDKFQTNGMQDITNVITTQELGRMINASGIQFTELEPSSLDMPLGFYTGAGVIFGATGGVMEAALRYAAEVIRGQKMHRIEFREVRGFEGIKEAEYSLGDLKIKVAVAHGLANARKVCELIKSGEKDYHFIEIMACPGGCIAGAGQPILSKSTLHNKELRLKGIYNADRRLQLHNSSDNYMVQEIYREYFGGKAGSHEAHESLHTTYEDRNDLLN